MEGPVRSMSRMPTDFPARESESASWVVIEDLPTPPLPERTWLMRRLGGRLVRWEVSEVGNVRGTWRGEPTKTMCLTFSSDIAGILSCT